MMFWNKFLLICGRLQGVPRERYKTTKKGLSQNDETAPFIYGNKKTGSEEPVYC